MSRLFWGNSLADFKEFWRFFSVISVYHIHSVTDTHTTFRARGRKPGDSFRTITLSNEELIRRFLMHVLSSGCSESPLLWLSEQPHEIKKSEAYF